MDPIFGGGGARDIYQFDILDTEYVQDIYGVFRAMQEQGPLTKVSTYGGHWVITGYDAARDAAQNWQTFTSTQGPMHPAAAPNIHLPPITEDPPRQQQLRRILNKHLSPQVVAGMEGAVRAHADHLIDAFIEEGRADLSSQFAEPLIPLVFFSDVVHLPPELLDRFMADTVGTAATPYEHSAALARLVEEFIDVRRSMPPLGDVIDSVFAAEVDGAPLSDEDVMGCVLILLIGGTDTTRNVITTSLWYLAQDLELRSKLIENPDRMPEAVEELLRLFGSVQLMGRTVTTSCTFRGAEMAAGEKLVIALGAANRDPGEFPDAEQFELGRPINRHVAFGVGVHRCLGAHLARLEIRVGLEQVLARMPDYRPVPGYRFVRRPGHVHGPVSLDVEFTPGPARGNRSSPAAR